MIISVICLAIASLLTAALIQAMIHSQRQLLIEQDRVQAEWLARSALRHACQRLESPAGVAADAWKLTADDLGPGTSATVEIDIQNDGGDETTRVVTVNVEYLAVASRVIRTTRSARWQPPADQTPHSKEP